MRGAAAQGARAWDGERCGDQRRRGRGLAAVAGMKTGDGVPELGLPSIQIRIEGAVGMLAAARAARGSFRPGGGLQMGWSGPAVEG